MDTMKKFFKYFLLVVLFYVFSTMMIHAFLKVSYSDITDYKIDFEQPYIDITEAKASNRDGHIYGMIKNNTSEKLENKYLKFSMLSKNGIVLGEKYVEIDKIEIEQVRKFEVKFDYDNVKSFKVELTDTKPEDIDFIELVKNNINDWYTINN